ncbi:MAG: hypothetical protein U0791_23415 [Gemmataceae bacterium]
MAAQTQTERASVYIDKRLLKMAKFLAEERNTTMAEEIERRVSKSLEADYRKAISREHAELGESGA